MIDHDVKTITRTVTRTTIVATDTITTILPTTDTIIIARSEDARLGTEETSEDAEVDDPAVLEARDTIVVQGTIPNTPNHAKPSKHTAQPVYASVSAHKHSKHTPPPRQSPESSKPGQLPH